MTRPLPKRGTPDYCAYEHRLVRQKARAWAEAIKAETIEASLDLFDGYLIAVRELEAFRAVRP